MSKEKSRQNGDKSFPTEFPGSRWLSSAAILSSSTEGSGSLHKTPGAMDALYTPHGCSRHSNLFQHVLKNAFATGRDVSASLQIAGCTQLNRNVTLSASSQSPAGLSFQAERISNVAGEVPQRTSPASTLGATLTCKSNDTHSPWPVYLRRGNPIQGLEMRCAPVRHRTAFCVAHQPTRSAHHVDGLQISPGCSCAVPFLGSCRCT